MKQLLNHYLLLALMAVCCWACQSKEPAAAPTADDTLALSIDTLARAAQHAFMVPGLGVGVIKDGKVVYAKTLGLRNVTTQAPVTPKSTFHMASVSKPFVATAIAQLVAQGKVSLGEKLTTYLPYFTMADERYKDITIKQMLTHTAGMPDEDDYEWYNPQTDDGAAERYARSFATESLLYAPGEGLEYSNPAFDILANVIAQASGLTFEAYMKKYILEPTGMVNSTFYYPEIPEANTTRPHSLGDTTPIAEMEHYPYNRRHAPSSTLNSTVNDMLRWAQLYLNRGTLDGKEVFSEATYQLMTTPKVPYYGTDSVCLSWFTQVVNDQYTMIRHGGGDDGYRSFIGLIPELKTAVVIMANCELMKPYELAIPLIQRVITNEPVPPIKRPIHYEVALHLKSGGIEALKAAYTKARTETPDKYNFEGWTLNELGYYLQYQGQKQTALEIFLFNAEQFPESAALTDSVGDGYRAVGNKEKAIEWYQKAFALDSTQLYSKEKMEALQAGLPNP